MGVTSFKDLTGMTFGRLKVLGTVGEKNRNGNYLWNCICQCGNPIKTRGSSLTAGTTKSCGCYRNDKAAERCYRHGQVGTRIHKTWSAMKERCSNTKAIAYKGYGAKGITVCEEWLAFEPFYKWAMGSGYKENLTIDRINGKKGYYPENCRWATCMEQSNNTSRNRFIEFNGETHTLAEWSRISGISYSAIYRRVCSGKSPDVNGIFKEECKTRRIKMPIAKYDLNMSYIQSYESIKEASIQNNNVQHIGQVANGERAKAGGFIWKYALEENKNE